MKNFLILLVTFMVVSCSSKDPYINLHPHGEYGKKLFKKQDANHDDVLTLEEVKTHHQERFDKVDRNQDGKISRDDARLSGFEQDYNEFGYKVRKGYLTFEDTFEVEKTRFKKADSNNDGKITKEEYKESYLRSFELDPDTQLRSQNQREISKSKKEKQFIY